MILIPAAAVLLALGNPFPAAAGTFGEEVAFLRRYTDVIVLSDAAGRAQVAVVPAYQGRVMTSTAWGAEGFSFGWVNQALVASGKPQPHINVFGGEDRFWIGPEGGQFSVFFSPGASFDLEHWFTPASLDTEPFAVVSRSDREIHCRRTLQLTNYSGTRFALEVNRKVRLLDPVDSLGRVGAALPAGVRAVAFESVNSIKNSGNRPWTRETGLLSIWILGMFNASPAATVVIPFQPGPESTLGPVVNDAYFGKVPADRLVVRDKVLFFRADAGARGKIGIGPRRAKPVLGSYDAARHALTLVAFSLRPGVLDYVNSMWQLQDRPFGGDVANSYNDGPPQPGAAQLGRFYELESSSPALALKPGESASHEHRTLHLEGSETDLEAIAQATLGTGLAEIQGAFQP